MASFAVKFLGCKVSQADAMLARQSLLASGHHEVPEAEAELHVINTCCITGEAEAKSRQSVRRSLKLADRVYVTGCAVNLNAPQFAEIDERVEPFVGTAEDVAVAVAGDVGACADLEHDLLVRSPRPTRPTGSAGARSVPADQTGRNPPGFLPTGSAPADPANPPGFLPTGSAPADPANPPGFLPTGSTPADQTGRNPPGFLPSGSAQADPPRTRGFVKVQDGCDCHCAYCIIPTVRGSARSRPASAVLEEARRRVAQGQPELVMTGISVGDYRDPERGVELGQLMIEVARVPGVQRVRLSSVEVIHVKDSLLEALATEPKVCPHLHVPMQSGDDGVLRAMGRHYTGDQYIAHIEELRRAAPEVNVTTDVIVGFPTEDEQAFRRTLDAVDAAGITRVHAFSYSPRPGTRAAALGDLVEPAEKKRRSQILRGHSEVRSRHHRVAKLGGRQRVLVDKVADRQCSGYTADYTRCYLPPGAAARGELVEVRCLELQADGIRCECEPATP